MHSSQLDMALNPGTSQRDLKAKSIASKKAAQKRKHHRKQRDKAAEKEEREEDEQADQEGTDSKVQQQPELTDRKEA